jgi:hypothetical protein
MRYLLNDLTRCNVANGLTAFAALIYNMDHADWRPFNDCITPDDVVVTVAQEPSNMDNSVCVWYDGCEKTMNCHAVCTSTGYHDYTDLIDWLEDVCYTS